MIRFPNAKINLGLRITGTRPDGYHDLQTVFYPIPFKEALECIPDNSIQTNQFNQTGLTVPGQLKDNLCLKAYELIKAVRPELPYLNIHLHKSIPMGAGLGGGSADAAFMLRMLNDYFKLDLREAALQEMALRLGSDCPFFLLNKPAYAEGRGEKLKPVELDLSTYRILIVNPGIHVSTGWAFSQITPSLSQQSPQEIIKLPVSEWRGFLVNDFEGPVCNAYPLIADIKNIMYSSGALYASMTGSGSTVFGIFSASQQAKFSFPGGCFVKWI
jgi:4-diphosphocytidyl-2-C-methyl-D-erythritol kinase